MSHLKCCVAKSATQVSTQLSEDLRGVLVIAVVPFQHNTKAAAIDRPTVGCFYWSDSWCRGPGRTSQSRLPLRSHLSAVLLLS